MLILIIIQTNLLLNTYFMLNMLNFLFRSYPSSTNKESTNRFIGFNTFCIMIHCNFVLLILIKYYLLTLGSSSIISSYLSTIVLDDKLV